MTTFLDLIVDDLVNGRVDPAFRPSYEPARRKAASKPVSFLDVVDDNVAKGLDPAIRPKYPSLVPVNKSPDAANRFLDLIVDDLVNGRLDPAFQEPKAASKPVSSLDAVDDNVAKGLDPAFRPKYPSLDSVVDDFAGLCVDSK